MCCTCCAAAVVGATCRQTGRVHCGQAYRIPGDAHALLLGTACKSIEVRDEIKRNLLGRRHGGKRKVYRWSVCSVVPTFSHFTIPLHETLM
jgi:hypothetical protein